MSDIRRVEQKYLMSEWEAAEIIRRLSFVMRRDSHDSGAGYRIRSLYFDTPFEKDYSDKLDGLIHRKKIRLRIYNQNTDAVRLEMKEKSTVYQRKRTLPLSREEAAMMTAADYGFLLAREEPLAAELYALLSKLVYRPKSVVEYTREAFVGEGNEIRITFDRDLRVCETHPDLFAESHFFLPAGEPGKVTMEVKYNGFLFTPIQ